MEVEDSKIVSVTCFNIFKYKGVNLIGIKTDKLLKIIDEVPDEIDGPVVFENGDEQMCYDFTALGLQVWTENDVVEKISCLSYND